MAKVTSEGWQAQQKAVWGDKDPEVFRRVVERIQRQDDEVLQEVERMVREGVVPHAIVKYITNAILRGVDEVEVGAPGMTCEEYAASLEVSE